MCVCACVCVCVRVCVCVCGWVCVCVCVWKGRELLPYFTQLDDFDKQRFLITIEEATKFSQIQQNIASFLTQTRVGLKKNIN